MTPDKDLSARLAELPTRWANTAPKPHHRGEELLPIVYADPGSNGWYYRERKPDSVTAYVRIDMLTDAVQAAVAKAVEAEREACAKRIDNEVKVARMRGPQHVPVLTALAAAIRSRGVKG